MLLVLCFADRKFAKHNPTWENLQYIEMLIETLRPFSALTDALSNSKSVTISKVWPMVQLIKRACQQDIECDVSDDCRTVSKEIRTSVWEYVDSRLVMNVFVLHMLP